MAASTHGQICFLSVVCCSRLSVGLQVAQVGLLGTIPGTNNIEATPGVDSKSWISQTEYDEAAATGEHQPSSGSKSCARMTSVQCASGKLSLNGGNMLVGAFVTTGEPSLAQT